MSVTRRFRLAAAGLALVAAPAFAVSTSIPPANQPLAGPQAAVERYFGAWRDRSPDEIAAVLTADYTAHMYDRELRDLGSFLSGSGRDMEIRVQRNLLTGSRQDGRLVMAPFDTVTMFADGFSEAPDPEHPDSAGFYRVILVRRVQGHFGRRDGTHWDIQNGLNIFHVVRGDVAALAEGEPADSSRWYIRRYIEDMRSVDHDLGDRPGHCGDEPPSAVASPASPATPLTLAIHALTNPACATLELRCELPSSDPASVDVYDVTGRLVNHRDVPVPQPGPLTIAAGEGARLLPGAYWVRLVQARQTPITRMVVVAR